MRPIFIPTHIRTVINPALSQEEKVQFIRNSFKKIPEADHPLVSVIIPAFNEEKNIVNTLYSLALSNTSKSIEIIVVNNNSTDDTEALVKHCGIKCILEINKGIVAAHNAGLRIAKGTYVLNADADAIYPPHWIDLMIDPMERNKGIALTYGRFSYIPAATAGRLTYFMYEKIADALRHYNKRYREEAANEHCFNSGYRRLEGLAIIGYNHPAGPKDGYLALKLRNRGFGKLHFVTNTKALVWTSDRRIQIEGSFIKGVRVRFLKYLFPIALHN